MFISRRYTAFANVATDYLSLADAKSHLRVTSSSDDTYISGLISMAIEACSNSSGILYAKELLSMVLTRIQALLQW